MPEHVLDEAVAGPQVEYVRPVHDGEHEEQGNLVPLFLRNDRGVSNTQTRKTRAVRRQLYRLHDLLPGPPRTLFDLFGGAFHRATALPFGLLLAADLLTVGRHTGAHLVRTLAPLVPGDPSSYPRVFSQRRWSSWRLARLLAGWVVGHLLPDGRIFLAGDDTVDEHRSQKVYGKARQRDPVRSTHSYTAFRWGHKWLVVAVLVCFPFTRRRWALPVLAA